MVTVSSNDVGNPYHDAKGLFTTANGADGSLRQQAKQTLEEAAVMTDAEFQRLHPDWDSIKDPKRKKFMMQATENWFGGTYEDINYELRENSDNWYSGPNQSDIRGLDRAFETLSKPLERDTTLYRGVMSGNSLEKFNAGAEFTDKGFNSTSHERHTAKAFSDGGVLLHIKAKKGLRVYVPQIPEQADGRPTGVEQEVLLNRGTRYRVTKRVDRDVYVEVM